MIIFGVLDPSLALTEPVGGLEGVEAGASTAGGVRKIGAGVMLECIGG